jgi:putative membrane protein
MTDSRDARAKRLEINKMARPKPWIAVALAASMVGHAARAQDRVPPPPREFAMDAAQSDQYEIQAAEDALGQSQNPQVRAFAQRMIADHTRSGEALRQAAMASGLTSPPPAMDSDQAALLAALQSLRGPDFDRTYAKQQVLAHEQALAVEQSFASEGTDPNLRRVARSGVPMIQHHLEMAQEMRAALGGS